MRWKVTHDAGPGWVRLQDDEMLPGDVFVRLAPDESGRLRVRDFVMRGEWRPLIAADLRRFDLAGIEEYLQSVGVQAGLIAAGFPDWSGLDELAGLYPAESEEPQEVPRLRRPEHGLTDDFLRHVADAYAQAVRQRKAPAPELARQVGDGATERTIHKWVYIARQRGIMPPSTRRRSRKD